MKSKTKAELLKQVKTLEDYVFTLKLQIIQVVNGASKMEKYFNAKLKKKRKKK